VLGAGVVRSSGAVVLDRAALEAARRARVPAAPAGLEGEVFEFEVRLVFALGG
jgi:TonB family protein